jgi:hypothetical protein
MDDIETLTERERNTLEGAGIDSALFSSEQVTQKALRVIDAQAIRIELLERDLEFCVRKLELSDKAMQRWTGEDGVEPVERSAIDCGEELSDILGGTRERITRIRALLKRE